MKILPPKKRLKDYLRKHGLEKQFAKQTKLFVENPLHPSLETELLEPRQHRIYSFRITKRYRAVFIYLGNETVEIVDINLHYK